MALSKNKIKYIQSLKDKKHRLQQGTFVAEGQKLVFDLLSSCRCQLIAALPEVLAIHPEIKADEKVECSESDLKKASFLKTPPQIIGVFYQPALDESAFIADDKLSLVLDGIQDPGNMGTIVRTADWFGIETLYCSPDTVDIYTPKTAQATMGAIARVSIRYTDIAELVKNASQLPVYGTFLEGDNIYDAPLSSKGFIVMGSEGGGIRPEIEKYITRKLFIPNYPPDKPTSESLNVAVATAIICSEFRRRLAR